MIFQNKNGEIKENILDLTINKKYHLRFYNSDGTISNGSVFSNDLEFLINELLGI